MKFTHTHTNATTQYYSALKKKKFLLWINLEGIMESEINQRKEIYHIVLLIYM